MTSRFIIESFWQRKSNCACVAFIKALILHYGLQKSFKIYESKGYILVRLRNNQMIVFTSKEITRINKRNSFSFLRTVPLSKQNDLRKIKRFTELCFAILVRNMQLRGYLGKEYTETQAIHTLTKKGVITSHFHQLLGIHRDRLHGVSINQLQRLKKKKTAFLLNDRHITILSGGWYEDFGFARRLDDAVPVFMKQKIKWWYSLR